MITYEQYPLQLTPLGSSHFWSFSSTNSGENSHQFIADVWIEPNNTTRKKKIARLKFSSNEFGNGIVDLKSVLSSALNPNITSESSYNQRVKQSGNTSNLRTAETFGNVIPFAQLTSGCTGTIINNNNSYRVAGFSESNGYNRFVGLGFDYIVENRHVSEYKVLIGEEYYSGDTLVQDLPPTDPTDNTGIPEDAQRITIWLGTNNQQHITGIGDGDYTSDPRVLNFLYNDAYRFKFRQGLSDDLPTMSGDTTYRHQKPAQFLTMMGERQFNPDAAIPFLSEIPVKSGRERMHHYKCPFIISYFNGNNGLFSNGVEGFTGVGLKDNITKNTLVVQNRRTYTNGTNIIEDCVANGAYSASTPTSYELTDSRIRYLSFTPIESISQDIEEVRIFARSLSADTSPVEYYKYEYCISEMLRLKLQYDDCINDPIHFLFLNDNGVWDTYTFGKKNVRRVEKSTNIFQQERGFNGNVFGMNSSDARNIIYNSEYVDLTTAQSWYMDSNDSVIVESLLKSPYVYLMKDYAEDFESTEEFTQYPYLLPVVITTNSVEEYSGKYSKLFQYEFEFYTNKRLKNHIQGI